MNFPVACKGRGPKQAVPDVRRRAAVIRGRVMTRAGRGIIGVRVGTNDKNVGTTMSTRDGWFDLMVNWGGAVTLQLGRPVFQPKEVSA